MARLFFLLLTFCYFICANGNIKNCEKSSACSCVSDTGVIDLSPLTRNTGPRFEDVPGPNGKSFSWNPCLPFTIGSCVDAAVCEMHGEPPSFYNLGNQDSAGFSVQNGQVVLVYSAYTDQGSSSFLRQASITLVCDAAEASGNLTVQDEIPPGSGIYRMTLRSAHACPKAETRDLAASVSSATIGPITNSTNTAATIGPGTHNHSITAAHIGTITQGTYTPANIVTASPPPPDMVDLDDIKVLLTGVIVMLVFISVMLSLLIIFYGYRVWCRGGGSGRSAYDNL